MEDIFRIVTADLRVIKVKPVAQDYDSEGASCCAATSISPPYELYIWGVLEPHIKLKNPADKVIQVCWNNSLEDNKIIDNVKTHKKDQLILDITLSNGSGV